MGTVTQPTAKEKRITNHITESVTWAEWDDGLRGWMPNNKLRFLTQTENNQIINKQKGKTMQLTQVQKKAMNVDDATILEAFYLDNGALDTSPEEFGMWFMNKFGKDKSLLAAAQDRIDRIKEKAKKS